MDIDAHAKHISKLLEFKEWAEAKIAELEAKLGGEVEAVEEVLGLESGNDGDKAPEVEAPEVDEEEKAAE